MPKLHLILLALFLSTSVYGQDPGTIITIAGGGTDLLGSEIPATEAQLNVPQDVAVDNEGNIYIADSFNHIIRQIDATSGVITTIAGTGTPGFSGDGGPATNAELEYPRAVDVNDLGEVFIGDTGNFRVRKIDPATGIITTVAGAGERGTFPRFIERVHIDSIRFGEIVSIIAGNSGLIIGDGINFDLGSGNNRILQVGGDSVNVIAGTGRQGYSGDGGNALAADLAIEGMTLDTGSDLRVYFADSQSHRVRSLVEAVDDSGQAFTQIETVAGNGRTNLFGEGTLSGDGGPAVDAGLDLPWGVAVGPQGRIYIMDLANHRIRSVELDGTIVTVAGTTPGNVNEGGFDGDGGLAIAATLDQPYRAAVDPNGDLIFIDNGNNRIRKIFQPEFRTSLLAASATLFNFGPVSLGIGANRTLTLENRGNRSLTVTSLTIDSERFTTEFVTPTKIEPFASRTVDLRFVPENEDRIEGTLILLTTDPFLPRIEIPLTGSGIVPDIDVLPSSIAFNQTFTDQTREQRIRISNLTQGQLFVEQIILSDTLNFTLPQPVAGVTISAGDFRDVNVIFTPQNAGPISAELSILSNDPDEPEILVPLSGSGLVPKPGGFLDLAGSVGVADPGASFGVAWADYDEDGDPDLYVVKSLEANRLYRNDGGDSFTDVASQVGVADTGDGSGAAWADYDGDGDLDLYVTNFGQPNRLYRNEGGTFREQGMLAGVDDVGDAYGAAWADTDNDGDPDLYIANFGPNVFFRNLGNGTFEEVAGALGIADSSSGIQPVFADFDNDQDQDLFVANSGPNRLWWNNGDGTFEDGSTAFVPLDGGASTGAAVGDFNNDGFLDLYVPYFGNNRLYQNQDGEGFTDVGRSRGVADPENGRGAVWGDFDNDGLLDLFITNRDTENKIFRNLGGDSQFLEVGETFGVNTSADSRGVALADFDGDGGLDMFVAIQNSPDQLFRNQEAEGNWLTVLPKGSDSSFDAIGARIEIVYNRTQRRIREITGGTSFLSQDALSAPFGLGEALSVDTLSIRWPSGTLQRFSPEDVGINRVITIVEEAPLPPVEVQIETTGDILVANGTAQTDVTVTLFNNLAEIALVSDRLITFSLDVGGGALDVSGPTIVDGKASARFTAGTLPGATPLSILVSGLPTQRVLLTLLPRLSGTDATLETIAGTGNGGFSGDGDLATEANFNTPRDVAVDASGNVYIADSANNRIRHLNPTDSTIATVAGTGVAGSGTVFDGEALDANIADPRGMFFHPGGDLIVSESGGQRIRRITLAQGTTSAFAGSGFSGFSGDGGPATDANLTTPRGLTIDSFGNAYLTSLNTGNTPNVSTVRLIKNDQISTVAGDPLQLFPNEDGVQGTKSRLNGANGVAVDGDGNLYIAEIGGHRIRRVDPYGIITTFAGTGAPGSSGDGGPARFLELNGPQDVAFDPAGRLFISDSQNNRVVAIELETGLAQTVAGTGRSGSNGNRGNALELNLDEPGGLTVAPDGSVVIADAGNNRVVRLRMLFQSDAPTVEPPPIDPGSGEARADFNGDGIVDFLDFLPFAEAFGSTSATYDLDNDGLVGFSDFLTFTNAFGRANSSNPAFTGIPRWARR